jgi:hypothetical protein
MIGDDWRVICLFIVFGGMASYDVIVGTLSKKWLQTAGTITHLPARTLSRLDPKTRVTVAYAYQVGEKMYSSNRISFPDPFAGGSSTIESEYPAGAHVVVFYDPRNPKNSCLRPGFKPNIVTTLFITICVIAIFLLGRGL